jgi:hypothetical protein
MEGRSGIEADGMEWKVVGRCWEGKGGKGWKGRGGVSVGRKVEWGKKEGELELESEMEREGGRMGKLRREDLDLHLGTDRPMNCRLFYAAPPPPRPGLPTPPYYPSAPTSPRTAMHRTAPQRTAPQRPPTADRRPPRATPGQTGWTSPPRPALPPLEAETRGRGRGRGDCPIGDAERDAARARGGGTPGVRAGATIEGRQVTF